MPKKAIDYQKTIMYKIVHNDLEITHVYIGHTTNFSRRKGCHKSSCNNEKNKYYHLKVYQMIRDNGGWENWNMIMIEVFPCSNSLEAHKRERELYEQYHANMNARSPYITQDERKDLKKKYREDHQEKIKQYNKKYREENKEERKEQKKKYREENKEEIKEYQKKYRDENKEKIKEEKSKKIPCKFCNKEICKSNMSHYLKICKKNITI